MTLTYTIISLSCLSYDINKNSNKFISKIVKATKNGNLKNIGKGINK